MCIRDRSSAAHPHDTTDETVEPISVARHTAAATAAENCAGGSFGLGDGTGNGGASSASCQASRGCINAHTGHNYSILKFTGHRDFLCIEAKQGNSQDCRSTKASDGV